jgi:hypothetical protein
MENGGSPKLQGLDSNSQGDFGPRFWQAFRDTLVLFYTVSLPDLSEEARFTLSSSPRASPRTPFCGGSGIERIERIR